mgnify:FL=1
MAYSREYLESLRKSEKPTEEFRLVVQKLADKVFANQVLTSAEEQFVCGTIERLKNAKNQRDINIHEHKSCNNYVFRNRYLLYFNDLNGDKPVYDFDGEIIEKRKKADIDFLQKEYENWFNDIEGKMSGNELINYVAQETIYQIKELNKYCDILVIGANRKEYLRKSLVLHGKYIYLIVKEYFQEIGKNEIVIQLDERKILIDGFTYVHTMFRHFAEGIKEHQFTKSYHFDKNIGFKAIPNFLSDAINCFKSLPQSKSFNNRDLHFIFNDKIYLLWVRPFSKYNKGIIKVDYLRVQTFYPVDNQKDLLRIKDFSGFRTNCRFKYLLKDD